MENLVILLGRLGSDPELRHTTGGIAVARFDVATSEKWPDKQTGEKKERVEWHTVEVWNKQGKACAATLKKGALVYIRGQLRTSSWEPQPGVTCYKTVIRARKIQFL